MEKVRDERNLKPAGLFVPDVVAAEIIGSAPQTLRNMRFQCQGPPYCKLGRSVRYRVTDLIEWVEKGRVVPEVQ